MPRIAWSIGLHAFLAMLLALGWVLPAMPEETAVLRHPRPRRIVTDCREFEKRADDHPPILPKEFQPDPVIINDAEEVVENTTPENLRGAVVEGDSFDVVSDQPFRGKALSVNVGLGHGAAGRYGDRKASFG